MTLTDRDLARKINLHPRAIVMVGTIETRMKNKGTLPGLTPHYACEGCPPVEYNGDGAKPKACAAEIEFWFRESAVLMPSALAGSKPANLVQMMYGNPAEGPNQDQYRVLREAAETVNRAVAKGDVMAVTLPVMTPAMKGATAGRHYLLGVFDRSGEAIYLNPEAVGTLLRAQYPEQQKERSTGQRNGPIEKRASNDLAANTVASPERPNPIPEDLARDLAADQALRGCHSYCTDKGMTKAAALIEKTVAALAVERMRGVGHER